MTRAKHHGRRLGWSDDAYRTSDEVRGFARWAWLGVIAREAPEVLSDLERVSATDGGAPDAASIAAWADRWGLTADWCLNYAHATWCAWHRYPASPCVWHDDNETGARWVSDAPILAAPRPLKDPEHFHWLACRVCLKTPWKDLSERSGRSDVRQACERLAVFLGIELPNIPAGRPRR